MLAPLRGAGRLGTDGGIVRRVNEVSDPLCACPILRGSCLDGEVYESDLSTRAVEVTVRAYLAFVWSLSEQHGK